MEINIRMKKININLIKDKEFSFKDICQAKNGKTKISLTKYGQIKPLIVQKNEDESYTLISGETLLNAMKEQAFTECYIIEFNNLTMLQKIDISNALSESVRNINILKLANYIEQIPELTNEEIAAQLSMKHKQIVVLRDLLKLAFTFKISKNEDQFTMFGEEEENEN